ncbi:MAG: hypothetical protein CBC48_01635 [bacterium TMED88]|nr:hypothetical protein [Deltaproteobacteria bacterium]OUV36863.1 MAG: hypothetical protein CBC48_01635 [bacterium TMED88]
MPRAVGQLFLRVALPHHGCRPSHGFPGLEPGDLLREAVGADSKIHLAMRLGAGRAGRVAAPGADKSLGGFLNLKGGDREFYHRRAGYPHSVLNAS